MDPVGVGQTVQRWNFESVAKALARSVRQAKGSIARKARR